MNADMIHFAKMAVRMYAETHPRPSHVTQTQGAAMLSRGVGIYTSSSYHISSRTIPVDHMFSIG